jgi:hypothetical protein
MLFIIYYAAFICSGNVKVLMQQGGKEMAVRTDWREVAYFSSHTLFRLFQQAAAIIRGWGFRVLGITGGYFLQWKQNSDKRRDFYTSWTV